jgi:hypothetical protein
MTPRGLLYAYRRFGEMCCLQSVIMEVTVSSETSVHIYEFARRHIADVTVTTLRKITPHSYVFTPKIFLLGHMQTAAYLSTE